MAVIVKVNNRELENIEEHIKAGRQIQARTALQAIRPRDVSPVDLVFFCSLLRRARLSLEVIRILQPLIYPKARSTAVATVEEKLEYASNLVRLGALNEAEKILNSIDANRFPIVLLRQGFLVTARWDYESANRYFDGYIRHPHAERYSILVAQVNFLQGLVYLRKTDEAWELAQTLLKTLDPTQNRFLLGGVCEFCAEIFRQKKDLKRALQFIAQGKDLFAQSKSTDEFLLRKQEQIIKSEVRGLMQIRAEAVERQHFESVRDIDFQLALVTQDEKLLNQVYWKTQSRAYKDRILAHAKEAGLHVETRLFKLGKNKGVCFDLESYFLKGVATPFKKDKAMARLLKALLVEGYSPIKIFDLFATVYPDEIFFPESSADKIHQVLKRLRQFIKKSSLPIEVVCQKERYHIKVHGNFSLTQKVTYEAAWQHELHRQFVFRKFDLNEAKKVWGCSERTALRRIGALKESGVICTFGKTRATTYRFL